MLKNVNHELNRRIAGLKALCIVICAICMLNLIRWILAPTAEVQFVNQGQMLLNLVYVIITVVFIQYLNSYNYRLLSIATVFLFAAYILRFLRNRFNWEFDCKKLGRTKSKTPTKNITESNLSIKNSCIKFILVRSERLELSGENLINTYFKHILINTTKPQHNLSTLRVK